jgi:hypothetical protein
MEQSLAVWIIGGFAIAFGIASIVVNVILATSVSEPDLGALKALSFVAFGASIAAVIGLLYFTVFHVRQLRKASIGLRRASWWILCSGAGFAVVALSVTGSVLVWATIRKDDLPKTIINDDPIILLAIWYAAWGITLASQIAFYVLLGRWTRKALRTQSIGRLDLDFGISPLPMENIQRTQSRGTHRSFPSQDITLNSPPRTPTSQIPSTRRSSATKIGTMSSSKIRLVKGSAKSSLDMPAYPAGEAVSIDSAFDDWDTSSVHHEMRAAVNSSPTVRTRGGLETIPGSRSESPANALDGPFLPGSPHAASSDTAQAAGWDNRPFTTSPPSSPPPNFSRPTSRPTSSHAHQKILAPAFEPKLPTPDGTKRSSMLIQDLIHPLFRPSSPEPPPQTVGNSTMVTAAPLAGHPITPRSLSRLQRSRSESQTGHWRAMPSVDAGSGRPSTAGSIMSSVQGSPGPSIVDEDHERELDEPVILPAFIMTAGQRSSLVGYGKRKSMKKDKEKRQSTLSVGSRLSQSFTQWD